MSHLETAPDSLTVCYFGTYREEYSRNQILMQGLRSAGVTVIECHETLWGGIEDRVQTVKGGWKAPGFWLRMVRVYLHLLKKYFSIKDYDVLMVGYPGQLDVFMARVLSWLKRKPLAWDIFMSIYLISLERGLDQKNSFSVSLLYWLEKLACSLPELLILDTEDYVSWFQKTYGVSPNRFGLVPTGADDRIFKPLPKAPTKNNDFRIVYYGTFIPNHGVLKIVEAARRLQNMDNFIFDLIGTGPERAEAEQFTKTYGLQNVNFINWLTKDELIQHISNADVCLGAFGDTPQSFMTVQNKIYECLAMKKAVLTGDGPAVRKAFIHKDQVYLSNRNSQDIAKALLDLYDHPELRSDLEKNGESAFQAGYTVEKLGLRCKEYLYEI